MFYCIPYKKLTGNSYSILFCSQGAFLRLLLDNSHRLTAVRQSVDPQGHAYWHIQEFCLLYIHLIKFSCIFHQSSSCEKDGKKVNIYIYMIYIYISHTHTHTHTHIYIYDYLRQSEFWFNSVAILPKIWEVDINFGPCLCTYLKSFKWTQDSSNVLSRPIGCSSFGWKCENDSQHGLIELFN